ncbi:uncharacterized protein B0H18DRAFT_1113007 [Fomitopsis serialis]|uniref:uncharacterized protein n=1 Tax=Fomitopsis serialis TaxID=139415 RepID=UPI002007DC8F|nr:uncharacterized protein B0H18DRAFT_1113007 [Neoantrodia serialis]KAH9937133.1 hypothetical protein B0H18DRAFT_1113007 [Neoantrodia serialis]
MAAHEARRARYMQVGLGDHDSERFKKAEIRPMFIGAEKQFRYFGTYEWLALPEKSQHVYTATTRRKIKDKEGVEISSRTTLRPLRAPCVLLKCIGFNVEFYREF